MFRIWGKIYKNHHLIRDMVFEDSSDLNRTGKVCRTSRILYDI